MEFFVKKVFKTSFWLLGCLLIFNFCVDAQEGVIVHKTIPKLSIDSISLREALFELSRNYNVPIGLEMSLGEESKKQILNLQNSTLEDALNSLIATNSNYQWRLNDGVINVYPKINRDIITQELLELNIDRFV